MLVLQNKDTIYFKP